MIRSTDQIRPSPCETFRLTTASLISQNCPDSRPSPSFPRLAVRVLLLRIWGDYWPSWCSWGPSLKRRLIEIVRHDKENPPLWPCHQNRQLNPDPNALRISYRTSIHCNVCIALRRPSETGRQSIENRGVHRIFAVLHTGQRARTTCSSSKIIPTIGVQQRQVA